MASYPLTPFTPKSFGLAYNGFMEPILAVKHLTKRFGDFIAVNDISFSIKEGEIVGLLGPNGAGKSTTIFMLLDLTTPTSGDIRVLGMNYADDREKILSRINYSSTYIELSPRLTVYENLVFMARMYGVTNAREQIEKYGKVFNIADLFGSQQYRLSAGQKTRVALAKAFLNEPTILLLDEPTASLDPDIADLVRKEILASQARGMTVLLASHNMAEVEEVCDRVLFIDHGKIVAEDTPEELAKAVRLVRVNLMMKDGQKRTVAFAKKAGFGTTVEHRSVTIEVDEHDIAYLLNGLAEKQVEYSQISIDKPTLEDYFIKVSKEGRR